MEIACSMPTLGGAAASFWPTAIPFFGRPNPFPHRPGHRPLLSTFGAFCRGSSRGASAPPRWKPKPPPRSRISSRAARRRRRVPQTHAHVSAGTARALRAAGAAGIRAVATPLAGMGVRAARDPALARVAQVSAPRALAPACRRIMAEQGFITTDGTVAMVSTGTQRG